MRHLYILLSILNNININFQLIKNNKRSVNHATKKEHGQE